MDSHGLPSPYHHPNPNFYPGYENGTLPSPFAPQFPPPSSGGDPSYYVNPSQYPPNPFPNLYPSPYQNGSDNSNPPHSNAAYLSALDDQVNNLLVSDSKPVASTPASPLEPAVQTYTRFGSDGWGDSNSLDGSSHPSYADMVEETTAIVSASGRVSLRVLLLHGNLDIWVHKAKNLPNFDMFHKTMGDVFGGLCSNSSEGEYRKNTSDPYVSISVLNDVIGRTFVIKNNENPVWEQHFYVPVAHGASEVQFNVKDNDVVGSQIIGTVSIPVEQIYSGERVEGSYPVLGSNGKPCKPGAVLYLSIQYIPMERDFLSSRSWSWSGLCRGSRHIFSIKERWKGYFVSRCTCS